MASFRPKFQIPSVVSLKDNGYQRPLLNGPSIIQSVLKENIRSFWFRKSKDQPVEPAVGNCGQPLSPPMDLVCKGCPSKCLEFEKQKKKSKRQFFGSKKQSEKPSNCKKEQKPVEKKLIWWETIFGPSPKRFWPDPCTCRLAHRERKKMRARDPRLRDPRYQQTGGDVLLYTEPVRRCSVSSCLEPQPKSPPGYKIPKAAVFKIMENVSYMTPGNRMALDMQMYKVDKDVQLKPYSLPYEELRPPERQRRPFSCKLGIQSKDVLPPINRDLNYYGGLRQQPVQEVKLPKNLKSTQTSQKKLPDTGTDLDQMFQKRSRIEQLKMHIRQKDMSYYPPFSF